MMWSKGRVYFIRLRAVKTRNCLNVNPALSLVHQFTMSAQKRWRHIRGFCQLANVLADVKFINGVDGREIGREAARLRTDIQQI